MDSEGAIQELGRVMNFMFRWRRDSSLEVEVSLAIQLSRLSPMTVQFDNIANQRIQ